MLAIKMKYMTDVQNNHRMFNKFKRYQYIIFMNFVNNSIIPLGVNQIKIPLNICKIKNDISDKDHVDGFDKFEHCNC